MSGLLAGFTMQIISQNREYAAQGRISHRQFAIRATAWRPGALCASLATAFCYPPDSASRNENPCNS
jgi:hypothetical protein